ncbi:MAG: MOSC domain-containing protein [Candidatus Eremiobacteraeota bacterium]|nr:MOSC domain-containing protein [Candidatus Eremiobacteraeota bacterium]
MSARPRQTPSIESVNVGTVRTVEHGGRLITTGIFKEPVVGRVRLRGVNLDGDDQADRSVHGGPERAAYAYAGEDYDWWSGELGRACAPGTFGENFTTCGIDVNRALIGERWRVGSAVVQVTSPRIPCYKLAMKMDDPHFVRRFAEALRPGAYLAIVEEGEVAAGDPAEIVHRPKHALTLAEMTRIYFFERRRVGELVHVDDLPAAWREWAREHDS